LIAIVPLVPGGSFDPHSVDHGRSGVSKKPEPGAGGPARVAPPGRRGGDPCNPDECVRAISKNEHFFSWEIPDHHQNPPSARLTLCPPPPVRQSLHCDSTVIPGLPFVGKFPEQVIQRHSKGDDHYDKKRFSPEQFLKKIPAVRDDLPGYFGIHGFSPASFAWTKAEPDPQKKDFSPSQVQHGGGEDGEVEEVHDNACQPDQESDAPDDGNCAGLLL